MAIWLSLVYLVKPQTLLRISLVCRHSVVFETWPSGCLWSTYYLVKHQKLLIISFVCRQSVVFETWPSGCLWSTSWNHRHCWEHRSFVDIQWSLTRGHPVVFGATRESYRHCLDFRISLFCRHSVVFETLSSGCLLVFLEKPHARPTKPIENIARWSLFIGLWEVVDFGLPLDDCCSWWLHFRSFKTIRYVIFASTVLKSGLIRSNIF